MTSQENRIDISDVYFSRSKGQVSTDLQGEIVLLNVQSGKYYNLNPIGSFIWERIEQPTPLSAIIEAILSAYKVDRERCETDTRELLQKLVRAGLVEITPQKANDAPGST